MKLAIGSLTTNRGTLGAAESRLGVAINSLQLARENCASAESQNRDVDVAEEAANPTRLNSPHHVRPSFADIEDSLRMLKQEAA